MNKCNRWGILLFFSLFLASCLYIASTYSIIRWSTFEAYIFKSHRGFKFAEWPHYSVILNQEFSKSDLPFVTKELQTESIENLCGLSYDLCFACCKIYTGNIHSADEQEWINIPKGQQTWTLYVKHFPPKLTASRGMQKHLRLQRCKIYCIFQTTRHIFFHSLVGPAAYSEVRLVNPKNMMK